MFNKLYILCFITIISTNLIAQDFNAGLMCGFNASWIGNLAQGGFYEWHYRIQGGIFVDYPISKQNTLKSEIKYSPKGNILSDYSGDIYKIHLHYIELPLLFEYYLPNHYYQKLKINNLYLISGLSYAYLVDSKEVLCSNDDSGLTITEHQFNKHDFLLNLGLGYKMRNHFSIECRFLTSIIPIRKGFKDNELVVGDQYNRTISLIANYKF